MFQAIDVKRHPGMSKWKNHTRACSLSFHYEDMAYKDGNREGVNSRINFVGGRASRMR